MPDVLCISQLYSSANPKYCIFRRGSLHGFSWFLSSSILTRDKKIKMSLRDWNNRRYQTEKYKNDKITAGHFLLETETEVASIHRGRQIGKYKSSLNIWLFSFHFPAGSFYRHHSKFSCWKLLPKNRRNKDKSSQMSLFSYVFSLPVHILRIERKLAKYQRLLLLTVLPLIYFMLPSQEFQIIPTAELGKMLSLPINAQLSSNLIPF